MLYLSIRPSARNEVYLFCVKDNKRISDFEGGVATLSVLFKVPNGLDANKFSVWYVADDGKTEKLTTWYENGHLVWAVDHFSDFIIVCEGEEIPDFPGGVQTGDNSLIWLWIRAMVVNNPHRPLNFWGINLKAA